MMWRYLDSRDIRGIQAALLVGAILLGICCAVMPPHTLHESAQFMRVWAAGLIFFGLLGIVGEEVNERTKGRRRWIPSFLAHVGLTGIYLAFAADALLTLGIPGTSAGDLTSLSVLCLMLTSVHRAFVHWRSGV
jgi:hypothetical protein